MQAIEDLKCFCKIKNKKKLYVRAKAVKVVGKKSYTGKWSKAKKVKVKSVSYTHLDVYKRQDNKDRKW